MTSTPSTSPTEALAIALDVSAVPSQPVGAGRYTIELGRALAALDEVSLSVIARRHDRRRWEEVVSGRATVFALAPDGRISRLLYEEYLLGRALARRAPLAKVLHAPHYNVTRATSLPTVVTVHDLTFIDHPEWHERSKAFVFARAVRFAASHAAVIVCPSQSTADRLAHHFAPQVAVRVIPHGIDHQRFAPTERAPGEDALALGRLGIKRPYVLHVGAVEPRKNLPGLIGAFDVVAHRHADLRLVLAGPLVWGRAELQRAIVRARHRERIDVLGYVDTADVPALLRNAEVVAYPSFDEGFGLPALEALACGARLVTTRGSAMAEVSGDVAWLSAPGDTGELNEAIEEALADCRDDRCTRAVAQAARYTWEKSALAHLDAYRLALDSL